MLEDLRALTLFVKTAELGSFRATADLFGLSPSVVSHHITQLEQRYDTALLYRSTRKLSLTADGAQLFERARPMVRAAEDATGLLRAESPRLAGKLTVSLPSGLVRSRYMAALSRFAAAYPDVHLSLITTDRRVDLIGQGIDIAIRAGAMKDSALKTIALGSVRRKLVCTPELPAAQPPLDSPKQLAHWPWIQLSMMAPARELVGPAGETRTVRYAARIEVDSVEAMYRMTRAGLGLSSPPDFLVASDLESGRLIEPLPGWTVPPIPVHAVWPPNLPRTGAANALIGFLKAAETG